jgi:hypothetical protein
MYTYEVLKGFAGGISQWSAADVSAAAASWRLPSNQGRVIFRDGRRQNLRLCLWCGYGLRAPMMVMEDCGWQ